jgi:outer membrane protein OmpA-like peptidoglycan-associated protein
MFRKLILLALVSVYALEATAQERTIVTSAPSAQEYVDLLFKAEQPKIRTRGIQVFQQVAAPVAEPAAPTPVAAPVAAPAKIVAAPVRFASNSAAIPKDFEAYLLNLAEAMKRPEAAGKVVIVSGHTDSKGNDASNMALSSRRARSVEQFLIRNGVGAQQVVSTGRGETQLIPGHEAEDALNRRVEFSVASF